MQVSEEARESELPGAWGETRRQVIILRGAGSGERGDGLSGARVCLPAVLCYRYVASFGFRVCYCFISCCLASCLYLFMLLFLLFYFVCVFSSVFVRSLPPCLTRFYLVSNNFFPFSFIFSVFYLSSSPLVTSIIAVRHVICLYMFKVSLCHLFLHSIFFRGVKVCGLFKYFFSCEFRLFITHPRPLFHPLTAPCHVSLLVRLL